MLTLSEWQETFNLLHTKTWRESPAWQNEPATLAQVKGLNILLRDGMIDQTRECKLHIVSKMVGREIESTNHLTKIEVHVLITILKDVKASSETEMILSKDGRDWIYLATLDYLEKTYADEFV